MKLLASDIVRRILLTGKNKEREMNSRDEAVVNGAREYNLHEPKQRRDEASRIVGSTRLLANAQVRSSCFYKNQGNERSSSRNSVRSFQSASPLSLTVVNKRSLYLKQIYTSVNCIIQLDTRKLLFILKISLESSQIYNFIFDMQIIIMPTECTANSLQRELADSIIRFSSIDDLRILIACGASPNEPVTQGKTVLSSVVLHRLLINSIVRFELL